MASETTVARPAEHESGAPTPATDPWVSAEPRSPFEQAVDDFEAEYRRAVQGGTARPKYSAYLARVPADRHRELFHQLACSRLELEHAPGGDRLRVERITEEYPPPPATADEVWELIQVEADARLLAPQPESVDAVVNDLRHRFPEHTARFTEALRAQLSAAQLARTPRLDGYQFLHRLGRGSQGDVFLALELRTGRQVAVKVSQIGGLRPEQRGQLENEMRVMIRLDQYGHRNIARVYGYQEDGEFAYFFVEYLSGGTLAKRRGFAHWPVLEALTCVAQLAEAIEYAHQNSVLHLDLKPENVLFTGSLEGGVGGEVPKIIDFGLFRLKREIGALCGTPCYMAPEQARGEACNARTDVWGLGGILFYLLYLEPLYPERSAHESITRAAQGRPVPPDGARKDVPPEVKAALFRALATDPGERFGTSGEFASELQRLAAQLAPATTPPGGALGAAGAASTSASPAPLEPGAGWRVWPVVVACAVFVLLGAGVAVLSGALNRPPAPPGGNGNKDADAPAPKQPPPGPNQMELPRPQPNRERLVVGSKGVAYTIKNPKTRSDLTDGITLFTKDQFRLLISPNVDCHLYVVNVDPKGEIALLYPHPKVSASSRVPGGTRVSLPEGSDGPEGEWFTLDGDEGEEYLYLIASRKQVPALEELFAAVRDARCPLPENIKKKLIAELKELAEAPNPTKGIGLRPPDPERVPIRTPTGDPAEIALDIDWANELIVRRWLIHHKTKP